MLLTMACMTTNAQSTKKISVGIMPFTGTNSSYNRNVANIQEAVTTAFVKTKRFNIVDRTKMAVLKNEKELQKTEDFIDGEVVAQGRNLGAEYLVSGHVLLYKTERVSGTKTDAKGNKSTYYGYKGTITVNLKVIDIVTTAVKASESMTVTGGGASTKTKEAALNIALKRLNKKIDKFVDVNFPLIVTIVEISESKKDAATSILIGAGSYLGLKKGDKLTVKEITSVELNGQMVDREREIGELKIKEVEGEHFSVCSVKKGGDKILSKFNSGAKLICITHFSGLFGL